MDFGSETQSEPVCSPSCASRAPNADPSPPAETPNVSSSTTCPLRPCAPSVEENEVTQGNFENFENDEVALGGKRKSWVWTEFKLEGKGDNAKARCMHCNSTLSSKSSNGTQHLSDHLLKSCMKRKVVSFRHQKLKFTTKTSGQKVLETYQFTQENSRRLLARMVVMHEYPLSIVDHIGFREFVSSLNQDFVIISRNTLRSDILRMFDDGKSNMKKLLEINQGRVAITTDMWTASNQKKGYMAITAHFVDNDWVLQNHTLRFMYVPHPHTSDVLASILMDQCVFKYNLENNVSSVVVDNCTTNDSMMDILFGKFDASSLMANGKFLHMRCSAHILNLIVKDGLDVIGSGIERIRDCISFWVATPKRFEKFEDSARYLKIQSTKKIHLDCKTRWNSTYLMLDSALPYKAVFERLKRMNGRLNFSLPSADDWKFAEIVCEKLKIFYDVTLLISGRKFPTSNLLFRLICEIKLRLQMWLRSELEIVAVMASKMIQKFDKYWIEMNGLLAVASILDPRNKLDCVDFYFKSIYGVDASSEIQRITDLLYDLLVEYSGKQGKNVEDLSGQTTIGVFVSQDSLFGEDCEDSFAAYKRNKKRKVNLRSELDHYLEEDVMPDIKQLDILDFWEKDFKYPTLRMIARDVLAIPVSTVAFESAFNIGGRVVSPHRSRLHANTVEALMCLQNWMIGEASKVANLESALLGATILEDSDSDGGTSEVIDAESESDLGMDFME